MATNTSPNGNRNNYFVNLYQIYYPCVIASCIIDHIVYPPSEFLYYGPSIISERISDLVKLAIHRIVKCVVWGSIINCILELYFRLWFIYIGPNS